MIKVLITGANGQLGQELVKAFASTTTVIPTDSSSLDINNPEQVKEVLNENKPDWVINGAAYTNVEGAAKDPTLAMKVNSEGTKTLSAMCKKIGSKLIYVSTNEVFDGKKETPYQETDQPNPINPYGVSKLAGETVSQEILGKDVLIVRTAWLYGLSSSANFPNKIVKRARETGKLIVVTDEISTPTYAPDVALWIKALVEKSAFGIFHLVNDGSASRFDWAKQIVETLALKTDLQQGKLADYPRLSIPPKTTVLSNHKAKSVGLVIRSWQEASLEYLQKLR